MELEEIVDQLAALPGTLVLRSGPGDGTPELAWGDVFCYYAPDGVLPTATQPFVTVVTKNYPDDERSRLDRPGAFRVNLAAGRDAFVEQVGHLPRESGLPNDRDPSREDVVIAHPVYGSLGWLAVVNPGPQTAGVVRELLTKAYDLAKGRYERRSGRP
ncbi:DUF6194 family protein [Microlunatus parietis]|uniref:DUF6194 domain-containing protein n=1 Tax=Microlunatus parietis TaxID=682979 RepID=A0A7Y9LE20_9ACTN|nr:DUF6194 family protein [Microlunatus parietis]NYE73425.1 hypothetical protein [Microlunatus parietis]